MLHSAVVRYSRIRTAIRRSFATLALAPAAATGLVQAQTPTPEGKVSAPVRAAVIDSVIAELSRTYVDADTGRLIGEGLRRRLRAGAYDTLTSPDQFGEVLTRDLRSVNGDLHLSLRLAPARGTNQPRPPMTLEPRQENFGLPRAEILDGNVGYLEIRSFNYDDGYQEAVIDALRFLSRTDAMILDIRRNSGGSGEMSHFLFSHFLPAKAVPTIRVKSRFSAEPELRHSLADVPGPRRPEVPLYVLTSQGSASAAEEFVFVLQNQRRATVVGTRTAGAGHMVNFIPVGHGFILGVSITRVSDPESGREWEKVGVQPDIAVPPERALAEAHAAAVRRIVAATSDADRTRLLTRLLTDIDARRQPQLPAAGALERLVGNYEGQIVSLADGRLRFARRDGALSEELAWLGGTRFALGATQLLFEEHADMVQLTLERASGSKVTLTKGR